ncbi:protein-disulfide reductase DsbD domain-containing protein [Wolbachia endosymbiont (group A) of Sicus ferrugineus]|uniref:protein-disulfide reductase DsbD domain-containing protein n=1 Tax=Wolbachia endosymbiont (group A) of Sicus ferrugineus TaxID=2954056 RepID=UPI002231707C|nr:protein-disulfide reductase DsbD domain-containing protein [Wolbachia endosymbiont (group A) of Sicus ferrugineus]
MKIHIYLILFLFFSCTQLYADEEIAKFDLLIGKINEANLTLKGAIKVTIEPGWHIYYKDSGDFGLPTSFDCKGNTLNIDIYWPTSKEHRDKVGREIFISNVYKDMVLFPFKMNVFSNQGYIDLNFHINYAICKDRCIPKNVEIKTRQPLKDFIDSDINKLINEWYGK